MINRYTVGGDDYIEFSLDGMRVIWLSERVPALPLVSSHKRYRQADREFCEKMLPIADYLTEVRERLRILNG